MCKFCESLKAKKQIGSFLQKYDPESSKLDFRYSVAIITRTFVKGRRGSQASQTDYYYRGCGYKLKFCPECGKPLTKKSAIDSPLESP